MKILMLTPYLPYPPSSGGQIRSYNLLKKMAKDHQVTLFSLVKFDAEKKYVPELEKICHRVKVFKRAEKPWTLTNIIKTGFSMFPFLVVRNYSSEERRAIEKLLEEEEFDVIHAETFYVSPHIPKTKIPIVLVDQTIEYQVYRHYVKNYRWWFLKPLLNIDVLKLKFWEEYYWKKASRVVAMSDKDAKVMRALVPGLKVSVIPNGVGEDLMVKSNVHYNQTLLFMGNYAWLQNIEAAKFLANKIFPIVKQAIPAAKLLIAGQNTDKVDDLAGDDIELRDLDIEDIDGVRESYHQSGVLVAPLYGPGGTRLKILGAMASHLPVVTTKVGIAGIGQSGRDYLEAETAKGMAEQTIKVLNDRKLYAEIAVNARELVEDKYSYDSIARELSDVYEEVAGA